MPRRRRSAFPVDRIDHEDCCIEGAVEAIKIGADDFLAKPYTDDELMSVVRQALERLTTQRAAQSTLESDASFGIVGNSQPMKSVFKLIAKAATMTANVLISGESARVSVCR